MKLDTPRNPSKMTYLIGSEVTFQLDGDENHIWYADRIVDFDLERGWIIFPTWQVNVGDITTVRLGGNNRFLRTAGVSLLTFGAGVTAFSLLGRLAPTCDNCKEALIVGPPIGVLGWLLTLISSNKTYKTGVGKRNKLRLLDLTPKPEYKPA